MANPKRQNYSVMKIEMSVGQQEQAPARPNGLETDLNQAVQKEKRLALATVLAPEPPEKPRMVKRTPVSDLYQRPKLARLRPRAGRNYQNQPVVVIAGHTELAQHVSAVWFQTENLYLFHIDLLVLRHQMLFDSAIQ